jgi:hypothetical protein
VSEGESQRERIGASAERYVQRVEFLKSRGWVIDDAARYVSLHHVRLHDDLSPHELQEARQLERRYAAPADFGIFAEFPPDRPVEPKG